MSVAALESARFVTGEHEEVDTIPGAPALSTFFGIESGHPHLFSFKHFHQQLNGNDVNILKNVLLIYINL